MSTQSILLLWITSRCITWARKHFLPAPKTPVTLFYQKSVFNIPNEPGLINLLTYSEWIRGILPHVTIATDDKRLTATIVYWIYGVAIQPPNWCNAGWIIMSSKRPCHGSYSNYECIISCQTDSPPCRRGGIISRLQTYLPCPPFCHFPFVVESILNSVGSFKYVSLFMCIFHGRIKLICFLKHMILKLVRNYEEFLINIFINNLYSLRMDILEPWKKETI